MRKNIYIIAGALLIAGVVLAFAGFAMTGFQINKLSSEGEYQSASYVSKGKIQSIFVDDSDLDVSIVPSPDEKIHVTYYKNEKQDYSIEESETGALKIQKKDYRKWYDYIFHIQFDPHDLTVAVPSGYQGDLTADTSNGSIHVDNLSFRNLTLDTSNASIKLNQVNTNSSIQCDTSNGRIELNQVDADSSIVCDTSNAAIELSQVNVGSSIKCKTSNGGIKGSVKGKMSDFSIASDTSNASNSLPERTTEGSKQMVMDTSNARIDITFEK